MLGVEACRGPNSDNSQFKPCLENLPSNVEIVKLLADRGYDAEANHIFARESLNIFTLIPPRKSRLQTGPPKGRYRREMYYKLKKSRDEFGKRWQVETVISMIKRVLGQSVTGRSYWSQCRDIFLKAVVHNITLVAAL